jgi:hypothetical protein
MSHTIGNDFLLGFPGTVSRHIDAIKDSFPNKGEAAIAFGWPVVFDTTKAGVIPFAATNTAADLVGFTIRTVKPEQTFGGNDPAYQENEETDVLLRGSMVVEVATGTPAKGGKVYLRKATGAIVCAAEGSGGADTVQLANVVFSHNGKDTNNRTEISILTRQM